MTYGYDSTLQNSTSTSSLIDFARQLLDAVHAFRCNGDNVSLSRPIIFLAHSMGGLVVKQVGTSFLMPTSALILQFIVMTDS